MTRLPHRLVAVVTVLTALAIAPARAGWRPVETLLVDADRGGAAGKRCVDAIAGRMKEAGEDLDLTRRSMSGIRTTLSATLPASVLAWTTAELRATRTRRDGAYDAVVVVDCRPDAGTIDAVIARTADEIATIRLRGLAPTTATIAWLTARIESASYVGFSP